MTTHISHKTVENILFILNILNQNLNEKVTENFKFTSQIRIVELSKKLSIKTKSNTYPGLPVEIDALEAAEILRACWDTKIVYNNLKEAGTVSLPMNIFRSKLNEIASELVPIAEFH